MIVMATVYALSVACGTVYVYPHIHIRHARLAQMGPVASRNGNERPSTTVQKTAVCIRKRVLRRLLQSQSVDTVSMMCPQTPTSSPSGDLCRGVEQGQRGVGTVAARLATHGWINGL